MKPTIIGVLGKPLAGKDTVANYVQRHSEGVATISMGEVVREVKAVGPTHRFWPDLHGVIAVADAGGIAPDEPIFRCLARLATEELDKGNETVIWVGGPRSEQQLRWLDAWTKECGYDEKFVYIDVSDDVVYDRVRQRESDGRADDLAVPYRLMEFERVTKPVVDTLREQGRVLEVCGTGGKEVVGARALESLKTARQEWEVSLPRMARR